MEAAILINIYDYYITPDEYDEAERNGINRRNVDYRIRGAGWRKEKAITKPTQKYTDLSKLKIIAMENGICYRTLKSRIAKGWDDRRATTEPLRTTEDLIAFCRRSKKTRKYPRDMVDLAMKNGILKGTFRDRARNGWDLIRAATLPPSKANGPMRLKELYGTNTHFRNMNNLLFAKKKQ